MWADAKLQAEGDDVENVGKNTWPFPKPFGSGKHTNNSAQSNHDWIWVKLITINQPQFGLLWEGYS